MKYRIIGIIAAIFLTFAMSGLATADVLPQPVPENQVFTTTSIIEAVGVTTERTSVVWQVGDAGLTSLPSRTLGRWCHQIWKHCLCNLLRLHYRQWWSDL